MPHSEALVQLRSEIADVAHRSRARRRPSRRQLERLLHEHRHLLACKRLPGGTTHRDIYGRRMLICLTVILVFPQATFT